MTDRSASRRDKLRRLLRKSGADALLVSNFLNVTYLTGFSGDDSYLLFTRDGQILISDSRYTTQLEEECPDLDVVIRTNGVGLLDAAAKLSKKAGISKLAIEASSMSVLELDSLAGKLPKAELVRTDGLVEQLREIKDKYEIQVLRKAVNAAQRAFGVIRASLHPDQTEKEVAANIEHEIRRFGGRGCSFTPIVAVGYRAALPHANPSDRRMGESDFVLIDWGANYDGYMSDLTRVLVTGKISPKLQKIYGVVLKAQRQAIARIKPGATMHEVDAAARDTIAAAGHSKHFGHGLGHGVGLEIHEAPRLAKGQDLPLKAGMVVTVEPGIYIPGWGGVRIEDDVLVTRNGCEVLTSVTTDLEQCIVG
jgi:Xaa-Pro aminopeptidase